MSLLVDKAPMKDANGKLVMPEDDTSTQEAVSEWWFENPNPFATEQSAGPVDSTLVVDETTVMPVQSQQAGQAQGTTAAQPGQNGQAAQTGQQAQGTATAQTQNGASVETSQRNQIKDLIAQAEAQSAECDDLLNGLEARFAVNGGDPSKLRKLREASEKKSARQKAAGNPGKKSGKITVKTSSGLPDMTNIETELDQNGGTGKATSDQNGKANGNPGGGDKMAWKPSKEELEEIDPIVDRTMRALKKAPPSERGQIADLARKLVRAFRENGFTEAEQKTIIDGFKEIDGITARSERNAKADKRKAEDRRTILGF